MRQRTTIFNRILLVGGILLLFSPCLFWLIMTFIFTPQERLDFEGQENQVLEALHQYYADNSQYPDSLTSLNPTYLAIPIETFNKGILQYSGSREGEFALTSMLPRSWFGWPAQRICRSNKGASVECFYYYICQQRHGVTHLTGPINLEEKGPTSILFRFNNFNPCVQEE